MTDEETIAELQDRNHELSSKARAATDTEWLTARRYKRVCKEVDALKIKLKAIPDLLTALENCRAVLGSLSYDKGMSDLDWHNVSQVSVKAGDAIAKVQA